MKRISIKNPNIINKAAKTLKENGLVVYPTETCYGLGANALSAKAIDKIVQYKSLPENKPLSIAVSGKKMAIKYTELNETAENLYDNFLPGPLTIITKGLHKVDSRVESKYGTLGVRIPDFPLTLKIIEEAGVPITATSANVPYQKTPYDVDELLDELPKKQLDLIDLVIDAGKLPKADPSTVVDTTLNTLNILRKGAQDFEKKGEEIFSAKTKSAKQTQNFGSTMMLKFQHIIKNNCLIFALGGELGSGKTQLTKGIAKQLGISKTIKSPTFTLVNEYDHTLESPSDTTSTRGKLVHMDTWRLSSEKELAQLNITKYIKKNNVLVIEWADKFFNYLKNETKKNNVKILKVRFNYVDKDRREIIVEEMV
jgi:L-threonylcarbamoyladenylate synthase